MTNYCTRTPGCLIVGEHSSELPCITEGPYGERRTPTPAPSADRAAIWEKWTGGERLAYGCGYRDARALDVERLVAFLRRAVNDNTDSASWRHGVEYAIECIEGAAGRTEIAATLANDDVT